MTGKLDGYASNKLGSLIGKSNRQSNRQSGLATKSKEVGKLMVSSTGSTTGKAANNNVMPLIDGIVFN